MAIELWVSADIDKWIAGALFDFLGYLTTRKEPITFGGDHEVPPAIELLKDWARERNLDLTNADVANWNL